MKLNNSRNKIKNRRTFARTDSEKLFFLTLNEKISIRPGRLQILDLAKWLVWNQKTLFRDETFALEVFDLIDHNLPRRHQSCSIKVRIT